MSKAAQNLQAASQRRYRARQYESVIVVPFGEFETGRISMAEKFDIDLFLNSFSLVE